MPELKGRRELFARYYVAGDAAGKGALNAAAAARNAGYAIDNARQQAHELLAEQEVQDRIAELADARNQKLEIDAEVVLLELLRMLTSDPALAIAEDGSVLPLQDIPLDLRRTIASFEIEDTILGRKTKVKFWSKEKAAELVGRHLTLFKDVLKVDGLDALAGKIAQARQRDSLV